MQHRSCWISLFFAASVATATAASADETQKYSAEYDKCLDQSDGVNTEMINCIGAETEAQDGMLNRNYKILRESLSGPRTKQLKEAQRAWIKFRDLNCGFYDDPDGGTMATLSAASCGLQMTADRVAELKALDQY